MVVRAKFRVSAIERTESNVKTGKKDDNGRDIYGPGILHTVKMSPVYGNGDPNHENTKFWEASPTGTLTLGMIAESVASTFEIGKEYYLDFTKAEG